MAEKFRFTKTAVTALSLAPEGKRTFHHDTETPGLAIQTTATGAKTFYLYRWVNGKPEKVRLGTFPAMTVEQARKEASKHLGTIAAGRSPRGEKREQAALSVTLGGAFEEYLSSRDLKPGTVRDYRRVMKETFTDWQDRRLVDITRDMVERRHKEFGKRSHARSNNAMRVLRAVFNFAAGKYEDAKGRPVITDNPIKRLSATRAWYRQERRQSLIRPTDLAAWWDATLAVDPRVRDWLHVMILTGLRNREAARLAWSDIDLSAGTLTVPDTKNRRAHILPLSDFLAVLFRRRLDHAELGSAFVFPAFFGVGALSDPRAALDAVIAASGVDFTPHDLRRTFITVAESLDIPAYALKRLMNHKSAADVTAGYLVLNPERLRDPMQRVTDFILKAAGVRESAQVVAMHAKDRARQ